MKFKPAQCLPVVSASLAAVLLAGAPPARAVEFWSETFETDGGGGVRYTVSSQFYDSSHDYSTRINDTNGNSAGGESPTIDLDSPTIDEYIGFEGQWYFAWEDVDDTASGGGTGTPDGLDYKVIDFNAINTGGHENLEFRGLFAAGDTDPIPNAGYDSDFFCAVLYSQDGGTTWLPGLVIRGDATAVDASNHPARLVNTIAPSGSNGVTSLALLGNELANNHRVVIGSQGPAFGLIAPDTPSGNSAADGTLLTESFQQFTFSLPNAASTLLRLVVHADDGNDEIAIDNFRIDGDVLATNPPPTFTSLSAPNVGEAEIGDTSYSFTVTYTDDSAVDASTIGAADVSVSGPAGVTISSGSTTDPTGNLLTATYSFTPPGGSWDSADDGTYTISINGSEVGDDGAPQLFVAAGAVGSFTVAASNTPPVVNQVNALDVPGSQFGATSYSFDVVYSDVGGVDASSINAGDVSVSGPGGALTVTGGSTGDPDGSPVTATYTVTPPGGSWDLTDDGLYTILINSSEVLDVVGASVAPGPAGTFTVDSNSILCETFETDGSGGARYTITGGTEFHAGGSNPDHFARIRDTNGNAAGGETPLINLDSDIQDEYQDFLGQWYFSAEEVDGGGGGADFRVIDLNPVSTTGHTGISFSGRFGAGDDDATPSYDSENFMAVLYSVDGGVSYIPGLVFRANVTTADVSDHPLAQVNTIAPDGTNNTTLADLGADLSGGDVVSSPAAAAAFSFMAADDGANAAVGTVLTHDLQSFGFSIPGTPATVRLRVVLQSDEQNDEMAFDHLKLSGTFTGGNVAPSVQSVAASDVGESEIGDTSYSFTVTYADDSGVDATTIDANDVTVTGPGGAVPVTGGSTSDPTGTPLTATYSFTPPGGAWDSADNGSYTIVMVGSEVGDDDAGTQLFVAVGTIGTFNVAATNTAPVVSSVLAPDVIFPDFGASSYSFDITYTDVGGVDASTIDLNDVTITGPGGVTVTMGTTTDPNGSPLTATYTLTPPGGTWDATDAGAYTIAIVGNEICDIAPNPDTLCVAANPTQATFNVISDKALNEGFESDGEGTRYTTNGGAANHFFDSGGASSYFTRVVDTGAGPTPPISIDADPAGTDYSGFDGNAYFAAENVQFGGRPAFRVLDFDPIDTSSFTGISFMGLFGAGDSDPSPSYDNDHFMAMLYSTDGGTTYIPGLVFRANGTTTDASNKPFNQVNTIAPSGSNGILTLADLGAQLSTGSIVVSTAASDNFSYMASDDGTNAAVGTSLSEVFGTFSFAIPNTSEVRLRLVLHAEGSNVEMAFDNFMVQGTFLPPEIEVRDGPLVTDPDITDGTATAIDFGTTNEGTPVERDFTIVNTGTAVLTIDPAGVTVPSGFSVSGGMPGGASIAGGSSLTFQIQMDAISGGTKSGTVSIENNDSDEDPFDFPITGVVNSAPVAGPDSATRRPGSGFKILLTDLLLNDSDPDTGNNTGLTITGVTYPASGEPNLGGSVSLTGDGRVAFDGPPGSATDKFEYTVQDSGGATGTGVVTVSVVQAPGGTFNITVKFDPMDGTFEITAAGIPGRTYELQKLDPPATVFSSFPTPVTTTADALGRIFLVDPTALPPTRLYRVIQN